MSLNSGRNNGSQVFLLHCTLHCYNKGKDRGSLGSAWPIHTIWGVLESILFYGCPLTAIPPRHCCGRMGLQTSPGLRPEPVMSTTARYNHRRDRPSGPPPYRLPRRLPVATQLPRLPQVRLHVRQQCGLSRHPRRPAAPGRRHHQHRCHCEFLSCPSPHPPVLRTESEGWAGAGW